MEKNISNILPKTGAEMTQRWKAEVRHDGLRKYRVITGSDKYIVEEKAKLPKTMKNNRALRLIICFLALSFNLLLTGCETPFKPVTNVPPHKALVYLYRKYNYFGSGMGIKVFANGQPVTLLWAGDYFKGSYYPYICSPGEVLFEGKELAAGEAAMFNFMYPTIKLAHMRIDADKTYYLRLKWINYNVLTGSKPALIQYDNAIGAEEITNCTLAKGYVVTNFPAK